MISQPAIELVEIGDEGQPVIVVDGFCEQPDRWRDLATACEYEALGDFYPGRRAPVPAAYLEAVGPLLGTLFRTLLGCSQRLSIQRALYSIVSTPPAELVLAQRIPHVDSVEPDRFALVHYLSHRDWGGTAFYRHRATGFEAITPARHRAYLDSLHHEFSRSGTPDPQYIAGDTEQFERIGMIDHRFNRAVLYPGNLLHCSATPNNIDFPDDPLTGRLTVAAFMLAR